MEVPGSDFETGLDEGKNAGDIKIQDEEDSAGPLSGHRIELTTPPAAGFLTSGKSDQKF